MPTPKGPARTKRCDLPPGKTLLVGPSDYKEIYHMKKVGRKVDLRACTRKSIRFVCSAKTVANRDAPGKKTQAQNNSSKKSQKRSSVKSFRRSHSGKRKSKSKLRNRASSVGKADTPNSTGVASKRGLTPPVNSEEPQLEPEVMYLPPKSSKPASADGLDSLGFFFWLFTCCGFCFNEEDDAAPQEPVDVETSAAQANA